MPESGTYGSVRGAPSNGRPYRNALPQAVVHRCEGNRNAVMAASDEGKTHIAEATQHPVYAANGPEIRNG
jgi:hypothetical protein